MAVGNEEVKRNLDDTSSAVGSGSGVPATGFVPGVPADQAGDSKSSDEAGEIAGRLAGVTAEFEEDAKKTAELCKQIEDDIHFIKDADKKLESDLRTKDMFIRKSKTAGDKGFYSLHFSFVLSSHPSTCPVPICRQRWVREEIERDDAVEYSDDILLATYSLRFKPTNGKFVVYDQVEKEVNGKKERYLNPVSSLTFARLNDLISHFEKTTPENMLKDYVGDEPNFNHNLYTLTRVGDIPKDVNLYLQELTDSHKKPPPESKGDVKQQHPPAQPQVPKRRYIRRIAAGRR